MTKCKKVGGQGALARIGAALAVALAALSVAASESVAATVGASFLAVQLSETGGLIEANLSGDVGPSQVLVATDGKIKVFDKAGNLGGLNLTPSAFFASVLPSGGGAYSPRVRYDRLSERWFITMAAQAPSGSRVMVAVSDKSSISGPASFSFFSFATPAGHDLGAPSLGVDANALYIGADLFSTSTSAYTGSDGWVVRKADLLAGTSPLVTHFPGLASGSTAGPSTPQGADDDNPNIAEGYFVGVDALTFGALDVRRVSNPGSSAPTISGNIAITVAPTYAPRPVPAQGTSTALNPVDDRLFQAMVAIDPVSGQPRLWTSHAIAVDSTGVASSAAGARDGLRWYELGSLSTTPALVQSGTVFAPDPPAPQSPAFYWLPSMAANGAGQALISSSTAGTGRFAQIAAAERFPDDPIGAMRAPAIVQTSASAYNRPTSNPQLWGRTSQTVVDPTDNQTFWAFQEYANTTNSWGVRAIQLKAPPPATPASASPATVGAGQTSVRIELAGTSLNDAGFFDPGADPGGPGFASRINASATGGVSVNGVGFEDRTHISLDLDTTQATPGASELTITNPDGQRISAPGLLAVTAPAAPVVASTVPLSPANDNAPRVIGSAYSGTTVRLYGNSDCNGAVLGIGTGADLSGAGIPIAVADNSSTTVFANATSAAGDVSPCSDTSVTYVEDSSLGRDTTPPRLTLKPGGRPKLAKPVKVKVSCDEACAVVVGGRVTPKGTASPGARAKPLKLKKAKARLLAGRVSTLKLKEPAKVRRRLLSVRTAKVRLSATAADSSGNSAHARLKLKLK